MTAVDELVRPDATPLPLGPVRARGWLTGREHDPRWVRPALLALLAGTAALYILGLGANGWANSFYTAAVQAGTQSWKAFFFGSFDAANFITVDKPPGSLWLTGLSARLFGVNAWSILVPQALAGVATVGLLYATVRRHFSAAAGLLAGAALALTPVATLMFRYNNPDALLVLLLVAGAYAVTRATETASARWLALAGVLVGFGFLTKALQALLVVPAFALVYLLAAPTSLCRRLGHLVLAGVAMLVAGGWWVAAVTLWPAASRPFIGGSQDNSEFNLIFGYNGFGRLTGNEAGSVGGGPAGTGGGPAGTGGPWGATGVLRLFGAEMGGQIAWLLPAAVIFLVALLWLSRRSPRTDGRRAALVLWGGWLLVTAATFSFANGIIHPYYNVALAPAIGALVGIGAASLWPHRRLLYVRGLLIVAIAATGLCSFVLLSRSPNWQPWLRPTVLALALVSATAIAVGPWIPQRLARRVPRRLAAIFAATAATAAIVGGLAGPAAYSVQTAATAATGPIPAAGPAVAGGRPGVGGGRGQFPGGLANRFGGVLPPGLQQGTGQPAPGGTGGQGGLGGLLDARAPAPALVQLLQQDNAAYTWVAATVGANSAAGVQLATGNPVLAIGGFNGSDPTPTLAQFQELVRAGKVHYFLAVGAAGGRGGFGGPGGAGGPGGFGGPGGAGGGGATGAGSQISTWVQRTFTARTVGGTTVYDLTTAAGTSGA